MADTEEKQFKEIRSEQMQLSYDVNSPTLFIDGFQGVSVMNGMVRINLYEDKVEAVSGSVSRHIVCRLLTPLQGFNSIVSELVKVNKEIQADYILTDNKVNE